MHVAYIITIVNYALSKLKLGKRKTKIITILFLIFFIFLTNSTPSVSRACIMAILSIIAILVNRKSDIINNMAISLFIILFQNPFSIFDTGLILSYVATLGIILLMPIFIKDKEDEEKTKLNKILNTIKSIIFVSICAQIAILPISICLFQTVSLTFIFSNLAVSFIISIITILGFVISIPINIPFATNIIISFLNILLFILLEVSKFFSNIKLSNILVCPPNIIIIILYYFFLLSFIYLKKLNKSKYKRRIEKKILTNVDRFKCCIFQNKIKVILGICIFLICFSIIKKMPQELKIYFIDVGQGDCTLIRTPNHKNILIDGGGSADLGRYDVGKSVVLPYLLNRQVKEIDIMIISHFDADHSNGLIAILENLKVKKLIIGKQKEKSQEYEKIMEIANKRNTEVKVIKKTDKILIDSNTYFDVLYPESTLEQEGLNNNSLVLKLNYGNFKMLFTGDIEKEAETKIVNEYKNTNMLNASVIKIAHHGSKTSSTNDFLELVKPKIALIRSW